MAKLRIEINHALGFDFFRINAKSEYIPPQFKSKAKVLAFVESKFGTKMEDIGVTIDDLFKS
ncbi:hypothetical protein [Altibacter sp. HG106]|uniref:hypothetical protein n=1 Tax=Altibacter sp. HG106 TaxID=3023937 RepID=UPI0023505FAB|nr:hypothetical protein [Altibacter sp. HG106]MDC7994471.1 hypothetical protein [Altibacter sp. HG106]